MAKTVYWVLKKKKKKTRKQNQKTPQKYKPLQRHLGKRKSVIQLFKKKSTFVIMTVPLAERNSIAVISLHH